MDIISDCMIFDRGLLSARIVKQLSCIEVHWGCPQCRVWQVTSMSDATAFTDCPDGSVQLSFACDCGAVGVCAVEVEIEPRLVPIEVE